MSKTTTANIFAQFAGVNNQTAKIEAMDGKEITYRELTMHEADTFNNRLINGYTDDMKPIFNYDALTDVKYEKLALCLVEPKVTVEDLKGFGASFTATLNEITTLIDGKLDEGDEEEGNDN